MWRRVVVRERRPHRAEELLAGAGLALARSIHQRSPATRVVLLTAYGSSRVEEEARRLGVESLLAKPQPLPALERHLAELVGVGVVPG